MLFEAPHNNCLAVGVGNPLPSLSRALLKQLLTCQIGSGMLLHTRPALDEGARSR